MPPSNTVRILKKLLAEYPDLHEELFRFTEPDIKALALSKIAALPLGELTKLADRAKYITLSRIVHRPSTNRHCRNKVIYDQHGANAKVKEIWEAGRGQMRIYQCPLCSGLHLTHTEYRAPPA